MVPYAESSTEFGTPPTELLPRSYPSARMYNDGPTRVAGPESCRGVGSAHVLDTLDRDGIETPQGVEVSIRCSVKHDSGEVGGRCAARHITERSVTPAGPQPPRAIALDDLVDA